LRVVGLVSHGRSPLAFAEPDAELAVPSQRLSLRAGLPDGVTDSDVVCEIARAVSREPIARRKEL
jgi:hypothetical protein